MNTLINFIVSLFANETEVVNAPAKPSWNQRLRNAEEAIDRAFLRNHDKTNPSILKKADIAANLRAQLKAAVNRRSEERYKKIQLDIISFERVGY